LALSDRVALLCDGNGHEHLRGKVMKTPIPDRETMLIQGWTHQVQWVDGKLPCWVRCKSGAEADARADKLKKQGCDVEVIDLRDIMQIH
jgi:hypothetical protein